MNSKLFLLSCTDTRLPMSNCVQLLQTAVGNANAGHSTIVAESAGRNKSLKFLRNDCQRPKTSGCQALNPAISLQSIPAKRFRLRQFSLPQKEQDLPKKSPNPFPRSASPARTTVPYTLNRCLLGAIVILCTLRQRLNHQARTKTTDSIRIPSRPQARSRPNRLTLLLRIGNAPGRGAASWRPQPLGLAFLSAPAATVNHPWTPPPCLQPLRPPDRTRGIYPGSKCAVCAPPRCPFSRRHRLKRP